jgi:hypothetical protein
MNALRELETEVFGTKCPYIWHTWDEDWGNEQNPPRMPAPNGSMFTRGWKRLGYPDAHLNKFWEA